MQKTSKGKLYSASDLVAFMGCAHRTTLDLIHLETPLVKTPDDEEGALIKLKGEQHEAAYLAKLKEDGLDVVNIRDKAGNLQAQVKATIRAMKAGAQVIYQAAVQEGQYIGYIDFLIRVDGEPSRWGTYSYKAADTKLARSPKVSALLQLSYYSWLLGALQDTVPQYMDIVLGTREVVAFRVADYARYFHNLKTRFEEHVNKSAEERTTYPDPCNQCDTCHWSDRCDKQRLADDHLSQVAGITRVQVRRLNRMGIHTLAELAATPERPGTVLEGEKQGDAGLSLTKLAPAEDVGPVMALPISPQTYEKLQRQAALQHRGKVTGERFVELLDLDPEKQRGFFRLPEPNEGDMFFDMEGNPLEEGGLEYLFGVYLPRNKGKRRFKAFWAHTRAQEKLAFEQFIDFVVRRLKRYPNAHIYHYAPYERTAMLKLMSLHGTREAQVDNLLRKNKFIDLYQVVREAIRTSEPRYSIKNIEHFYLDKRTVEVKNAGASIVYYERWKATQDPQLLQDIADYNFDDVRSTYELLVWLMTYRSPDLPWANQPRPSTEGSTEQGRREPELGEMTETEKRLLPFYEALVRPLPEDREQWTEHDKVDELVYQLLDFHRREAKPEWWAMFARMTATTEELINDSECLGGLVMDEKVPPEVQARSMLYTYRYPPQDTKLRTGVSATLCTDGSSVSNLVVFPEENKVTFTVGRTREQPPETLSLGPGSPISSKPMVEALYRFAQDWKDNPESHYPALSAFLHRAYPKVKGVTEGDPIVAEHETGVQPIVKAVAGLQESYLFLQGPPGAGKTYTGSHVIVDLLERGYKVGIASNSHHAVNNLLAGVEKVALSQRVKVRGIKKSNKGEGEYQSVRGLVEETDPVFIGNGYANEYVLGFDYNLVAGTAWLFSLPALDQQLDYLFIDEAGQVSLANLIAMGTSARNLVLLGDQMQLAQPSKGIHPGASGDSSLDYLLQGRATIPPESGIFLGETYRMHPDVCRFISEAVYDGRLKSNPATEGQTLVLEEWAHPALRPTGISYVPVVHDGCAQDSEEEAKVVAELVDDLLDQHYRDKEGQLRPMTLDNILVVAPYNMQVNLLKRYLPPETRVGTVDKFQGQEAEVVLVSMATSNAETMPRNMEFLFSKNRLNVAISRAKCLAIMVASPDLLAVPCNKPEQLNLVNTLCWVTSMAEEQQAA